MPDVGGRWFPEGHVGRDGACRGGGKEAGDIQPGMVGFPDPAVRIEARYDFAKLFPVSRDVEIPLIEDQVVGIPNRVARDEFRHAAIG